MRFPQTVAANATIIVIWSMILLSVTLAACFDCVAGREFTLADDYRVGIAEATALSGLVW